MLNAQCSMLNAQCSMLNAQCSMRTGRGRPTAPLPAAKGWGQGPDHTLRVLPSPWLSQFAQAGQQPTAGASQNTTGCHMGKVPPTASKLSHTFQNRQPTRAEVPRGGARPRATGVSTACMRCAGRGDSVLEPQRCGARRRRRRSRPGAPACSPRALLPVAWSGALFKTSAAPAAPRGDGQRGCSALPSQHVFWLALLCSMTRKQHTTAPAPHSATVQQAHYHNEHPSDAGKSTARPSACLAQAAGAHAVRGPAGVAGRRGARAGALGHARPPLRAHLALLARQLAALAVRRRAVAGRHVLLRIRALQRLRFCRLRGGRHYVHEVHSPSLPVTSNTSAELAVGQRMRMGAGTALGASETVHNMTQAHRRRRGAGGEARGGVVGQHRPALRGRAGSLRALDVRAARRREGRAPEGQHRQALGLDRRGPRLLRRSTG